MEGLACPFLHPGKSLRTFACVSSALVIPCPNQAAGASELPSKYSDSDPLQRAFRDTGASGCIAVSLARCAGSITFQVFKLLLEGYGGKWEFPKIMGSSIDPK